MADKGFSEAGKLEDRQTMFDRLRLQFNDVALNGLLGREAELLEEASGEIKATILMASLTKLIDKITITNAAESFRDFALTLAGREQLKLNFWQMKCSAAATVHAQRSLTLAVAEKVFKLSDRNAFAKITTAIEEALPKLPFDTEKLRCRTSHSQFMPGATASLGVTYIA